MSIFKLRILRIAGLPLLAAIVTFIALMIDASITSGLPRPVQGESVTVPLIVCVGIILVTALLLPWLACVPFLRQPHIRIHFFVCLAIVLAGWYFFFGSDHLLSKAYRRGL